MSGCISSCGPVTFRSSTSCSCSSRCRTGSIACIRCIGGGVGSGVRNGVGDCNIINIDYNNNYNNLVLLSEVIPDVVVAADVEPVALLVLGVLVVVLVVVFVMVLVTVTV